MGSLGQNALVNNIYRPGVTNFEAWPKVFSLSESGQTHITKQCVSEIESYILYTVTELAQTNQHIFFLNVVESFPPIGISSLCIPIGVKDLLKCTNYSIYMSLTNYIILICIYYISFTNRIKCTNISKMLVFWSRCL